MPSSINFGRIHKWFKAFSIYPYQKTLSETNAEDHCEIARPKVFMGKRLGVYKHKLLQIMYKPQLFVTDGHLIQPALLIFFQCCLFLKIHISIRSYYLVFA